MTDASALPTLTVRPDPLTRLDQLAAITEEEIWLAKQRIHRPAAPTGSTCADSCARSTSPRPPRCARSIIAPSSRGSGCSASKKAQPPQPCAAASRRCPACSSTLSGMEPPPVTRSLTWSDRRSIAARAAPPRSRRFQARKILDAPPDDTLAGLRDRAILSVGLQVGFRRAEIAALNVGDLHENRGFDALRVTRKGRRREALAINPQAAQRIRAYLDLAGHGGQLDAPLFRPLRGNANPFDPAGRMDPDTIDRLVRKYASEIGLARGYSAHSMRATFITTALENGAPLEDVQKAAGHRDPSTTKLYDRRHYNPEKAASFFATY